jgi:aspartate-semialdehyde dehydrogenase
MMVSATCVRVPVFRAHSEAINIETEEKLTAEQAREILSKAPGISVMDKCESGGYPVPHEVTESFDTWVGRIREDISTPKGLTFWVVADQLYKGAALNAIQIGELLNRA